MANEIEKLRLLINTKDKWSDIMEDIQGTVNKNRRSHTHIIIVIKCIRYVIILAPCAIDKGFLL
jgi:hypothetical protein